MPTGYTAPVRDNPNLTFRDFAMNCARAFVALVTLRDSPHEPVPEKFAPDDFYEKCATEAADLLAAAAAMTDDEACDAAAKAHEADLVRVRTSNVEGAQTRARYERMLAEAEAWEPPTPEHEGLKQFMVDQLRESIDYDCHVEPDPQRISGSEYRAMLVELHEATVTRCSREAERERTTAAERTRWVCALRASLPGTP